MSPNIGKKRDEWVGAPWIISTREAKGLHSPRDNAALFACEVINHHQESLAEPGVGHSIPVRSLIKLQQAKENKTSLMAPTQPAVKLLTGN